MSIYGITGGIRPDLLPVKNSAPKDSREAQPAPAPATGSGRTDQIEGELRGLEPTQATLSTEAPEGTDPELWSVLTVEERAYYARAQVLGPLTYGPGEALGAQEPMARGVRLDLRV